MNGTLCTGCGRRDGTHEDECLVARREERHRIQAECDHRPDYGTRRTTGEPLGPDCCGRCDLMLHDGEIRVELAPNGDEEPTVFNVPREAYARIKADADARGEHVSMRFLEILRDGAKAANDAAAKRPKD